LAAPGLVNQEGTAILSMPGRLGGLEHFEWSEYLNFPAVKVLNDAHAAITAECTWGAGKGRQHVAMLTLGTGVGGGLFIDGKLYQGFLQRAGHLGHMGIDSDELLLDITNIPGSLEDAIGNATVQRRSYGKYKATDELVAAYNQGEPLATLVWLNSFMKLATALCSICNIFSPELILLGGGISQAGLSLFKPLDTFMALFEWFPTGERTTVRQAAFGSFAGALGAAAHALNADKKINS